MYFLNLGSDSVRVERSARDSNDVGFGVFLGLMIDSVLLVPTFVVSWWFAPLLIVVPMLSVFAIEYYCARDYPRTRRRLDLDGLDDSVRHRIVDEVSRRDGLVLASLPLSLALARHEREQRKVIDNDRRERAARAMFGDKR